MWLPRDGRVRVVLRQGAGPEDELKAFYQSLALRHLHPTYPDIVKAQSRCTPEADWPASTVRRLLLTSYEMTVHKFPVVLKGLREMEGVDGWDLSRVLLGSQGWRLEEGGADKGE